MSIEIHTILGVRFKVGSGPVVIEEAAKGGLIVVPSAPVLVGISEDVALREAVIGADMAITDSGLMVLLWRAITGRKLERVSGLEYLKLLLARPEVKVPGAVFWVMPTEEAKQRNLVWLQSVGFPTCDDDCYVAPMYGQGSLIDEALLARVRTHQPRHIILCLGGGVQERIGYYLNHALSHQWSAVSAQLQAGAGGQSAGARPSIHCIGAAIGFLSGDQVKIPTWVDYLYLGWLWRIASSPGKFFPRYWKATRLVGLMWRYRERVPVR